MIARSLDTMLQNSGVPFAVPKDTSIRNRAYAGTVKPWLRPPSHKKTGIQQPYTVGLIKQNWLYIKVYIVRKLGV